MKKLLLLLTLFFSTSLLIAQNFNQPSQFNTVCDDNNDGFASFYLDEISFEILGNLNSQDYVITHHETQTEAQTGINPLSSTYFNIVPLSQTLYARIVTVTSGQVTILPYSLNVNPLPNAPTQTISLCSNTFQCWDLTSVESAIAQGTVGFTISFYQTEANAQTGSAAIASPSCYVSPTASPTQEPVFYRIENTLTGCFAVGIIELKTLDCGSGTTCNPPTAVTTSVTQTTATIAWTNTDNTTQSLVYVTPAGGPAPTAASTAYYTQGSPYILTGLQCGSAYDIYIRTFCNSANLSTWVQTTFSTVACTIQAGQPTNLNNCVSNGQACFNLTDNDSNIYGNLTQTNYSITYHLSQADANVGTNALQSPYCITSGSQVLFARLTNTVTQEFQIFSFAVVAETVSSTVVPLADMHQCDDNNDTIVTFDLTTVHAQINSTNTLEYYPSLANAQNQVVPFANPQALNIGVQNPITAVFVREIVPNSCDIIYSFNLYAYSNCNLAYTCNQANSLCNSLGVPFSNTVNLPGSGTVNCLGSTPNPTWFYLPVSGAGTINLQIAQVSNAGSALDVDYIVYGPFADPVAACGNTSLLLSNVVSCSYSTANVEYPVITNAQPGQYYIIMVTNYSNQPGFITITELTTTVGAIDCSGMRFHAFLDANNNGTQDNGEVNFPLGQFTSEVNSNGNIHNIVSPTGVYNIYDTNASNSYNVSYTIDPNYAPSYNLTTASYSNLHVVVGGGMQTYNFPITVTQVYNDLAVNIIPINAPRPGFTYQNKIVYTNFGNQTVASGTITFTKDALVTIIGNTQSGTTATANGFSYGFTNLLPFETREMTVILQVPALPTVALGNLLTNTASIAPITGDVVPTNNTSSCSQIIIGSYDPNDKMESHGERILYSSFSNTDYLYYTIRFENTGTASAINVRVNDVLDSKLDETSIKMISASNPYIMDRIGNNLTWRFDDIQLPPTVANTNTGKGYITFQVKPRAGYAVGTIIPNTASIYFDYNAPIITNTFNTEFVAQLGLNEFENGDFVFYPNPVSDIVTVALKNNGSIANIAVYDMLGKLIVSQKPNSAATTETVDLSSISKGIYLLEVTTDTNVKVVKKLLVD
ncbi:T9SS type A sorting domain-containing protein [Flavobacterium sp. N1994]|uniref:T9SS type A sorting domain-containing protein n=1 Tax=Flavobacterium sp. N1994 TaxID=2986827 RepID=UPI002223CE14|nr:T9SS type A sorting domain-containing protein [Flavobacterium sp. N1994]